MSARHLMQRGETGGAGNLHRDLNIERLFWF